MKLASATAPECYRQLGQPIVGTSCTAGRPTTGLFCEWTNVLCSLLMVSQRPHTDCQCATLTHWKMCLEFTREQTVPKSNGQTARITMPREESRYRDTIAATRTPTTHRAATATVLSRLAENRMIALPRDVFRWARSSVALPINNQQRRQQPQKYHPLPSSITRPAE